MYIYTDIHIQIYVCICIYEYIYTCIYIFVYILLTLIWTNKYAGESSARLLAMGLSDSSYVDHINDDSMKIYPANSTDSKQDQKEKNIVSNIDKHSDKSIVSKVTKIKDRKRIKFIDQKNDNLSHDINKKTVNVFKCDSKHMRKNNLSSDMNLKDFYSLNNDEKINENFQNFHFLQTIKFWEKLCIISRLLGSVQRYCIAIFLFI
jgi:hypothetical protein